jgi:hypothetical protein
VLQCSEVALCKFGHPDLNKASALQSRSTVLALVVAGG